MHSILMYATRAENTTPAQFQSHYENTHIPLVQALAGSLFPAIHSRRYILRSETSASKTTTDPIPYPAVVLSGTQEDFHYDAVVEMRFTSEEAAGEFFQFLAKPDVAQVIQVDCEKFMDQTKAFAVVLGDVFETKVN